MARRQKRGVLISFEGGEGSGKSTQMRLMVDWLKSQRRRVMVTQEPGGTDIGGRIRELLLNPNYKGLSPRAELLLYLADRAQHAAEAIGPALEAGRIILTDRYFDSSTVYQGICRGLGAPWVQELNLFATGGIQPDLTFVFDVPVATGLSRIRRRIKEDVWLRGTPKRVKLDRLDLERRSFHESVRKGFRSLARKNARRIKLIDGTPEASVIAANVKAEIERLLKRKSL